LPSSRKAGTGGARRSRESAPRAWLKELFRDSLPKSPVGKTLRRQLAAPPAAGPRAG
jgi:hypothetical protein